MEIVLKKFSGMLFDWTAYYDEKYLYDMDILTKKQQHCHLKAIDLKGTTLPIERIFSVDYKKTLVIKGFMKIGIRTDINYSENPF